jgi:hypothetical protein
MLSRWIRAKQTVSVLDSGGDSPVSAAQSQTNNAITKRRAITGRMNITG